MTLLQVPLVTSFAFCATLLIMSDETTTYQLIVRQQPVPVPELDELLRALHGGFGLDVYTARQRLVGPGLVMFGKGSLEKTREIAALLHRYSFACWQMLPTPSTVTPARLRSLEVHKDHVLFECQGQLVRLERGAKVLGVFADISGALVDKHVKRLLAQNTYRGRDAIEPLDQEELLPTIFRGQPVFDFYLFGDQNTPERAVRVLPGRFNPSGLGDRASLSARGNLEALLALVKEYAQDFRLHCDFGLSQLPQCPVLRLDRAPSAVEDNLKSLNRYGWLLTQLQGDGLPGATPEGKGSLTSGAAVAVTLGQPALAEVLGAGVEAIPELAEVSRDLSEAITKEDLRDTGHKGEDAAAKKDLPPPPEWPQARMTLGKMLTLVGAFLGAGLFVAVLEGDGSLAGSFARYGLNAGILPGLAAAGLFWSGFHCICLKRKIENTPTSKVRSMAMGLVEVHGKAWRQYALVAPMTQSACVYYRLRTYRRDNNKKWKLIKDVDSSHVAFQVDDGTGRVVVDPQGAAVKAKTRQSGYPGQTPLTFTSFNHADEDEKWVEDVIYEGTTLYVLGFAQPLKAERQSLRDRTVEKLRELKLDRRALHRYDADGDGQISESEWQVARSDAEQMALKEHLAQGAVRKRQEEHVVIARPPQRGMPFVIAETASEAHLARNYGLCSIALMLAGLVAAGGALYKLLEFLNV